MPLENKYDAEVKAQRVIDSCVTVAQLEMARKFAIRAYRLMHPKYHMDAYIIQCAPSLLAEGQVRIRIENRRLEIDPEFRAQKAREARLMFGGIPPEEPRATRVLVDVTVS